MANKNDRVINKHDTSAHWEKAINFIPKAGEIIIYDDLGKMKVGDGETPINQLNFFGQSHSLTIGSIVYDGSEDVVIDTYNGERS